LQVKEKPEEKDQKKEAPVRKAPDPEVKMPPKKEEKSKEEIMAEREAKKAEKAAKKAAAKENKPDESKAAAAESATKDEKKLPADEKPKEAVMAEREAKKAEKAARRAAALKAKEAEGGGGGGGGEQQPQQPQQQQKKQTQPLKPKQDAQAVAAAAPGTEGGKSKAELKAERRAKQEAQRAAKAASAEEKKDKVPAKAKAQRVPDDMQADRACIEKKLEKKLASAQIPARTKAQRKVMLFSHLHQYERELSISRNLPVVGGPIHPAVLELGLRYAEGTISGSNARCVALLRAMKRVISDYVTPPQKELHRDLDSTLKPLITFLRQCRTLSVSMGNAIRFLKGRINAVGLSGVSDDEARDELCRNIDDFVDSIALAGKQISITAGDKIRHGDVILTYGCSSLLRTVFSEAARAGKRFRVIVADGRPRFEGRAMARHMVAAGIECSYIQVTSAPYVMQEVTKVMLGAHAVLANGGVMARVGASQVALVAKSCNVPVLVCCETYKFSERVQTDSFVFNELGDPDDLVATGSALYTPLEDWRDLSSLNLLNLNYDVTPPSLVDAIVSEISVIPTTSVPVVLRLKNIDHAAY